jgi:hypothetical protein
MNFIDIMESFLQMCQNIFSYESFNILQQKIVNSPQKYLVTYILTCNFIRMFTNFLIKSLFIILKSYFYSSRIHLFHFFFFVSFYELILRFHFKPFRYMLFFFFFLVLRRDSCVPHTIDTHLHPHYVNFLSFTHARFACTRQDCYSASTALINDSRS